MAARASQLATVASATSLPDAQRFRLPRQLIPLYLIAPILTAPILLPGAFKADSTTLLRHLAGSFIPFLAIPAAIHPFYAHAVPRLFAWLRLERGHWTVHAALSALVASAVAVVIHPLHAAVCGGSAPLAFWIANCVVITWAFLLPALIVLELRARAHEVERCLLEERQAALKAQIEAISSRTNPHFLFNTIRVYGSAWNEPDPEKRLCALEQSMSESATYVDPTIDTANLGDLARAIGDFQTSAPKASIVQLSALDARNGELRFAWDFRNDGTSAITGLDYVEIAADGRIASIRGYWDPVPSDPPAGVLAAYVAAWKASDASSRRASLDLAVGDDVRFTSPDATTTGLQALSEAMASTAATSIEVTGTQPYPKFARVAFSIATPAGSQQATDYLQLGADGKIARIARFVGPVPPL